jgi:predicted metal-dependent hydrolase
MTRRPAPETQDLQLSLPLLHADARPSPAPAAPAPPRPRPHLLRHPRGNREISLGGQLIAYELKRARRRTIGFVIGTEGLAVSAPRWVGQPEIDAALASKARWILRKLVDQGERAQRVEAARIEWRDGACLPFLGGTLRLVLDPGTQGAALREQAEPSERCLHIGLSAQADAAQIRAVVQRWLQGQALQLFEARCRHYAAPLGVQIARLRLSSAQTRWGSASADGTVRLNWRLVHFALASIDYVVVHELAHLREMNHSPAFWAVVRSVMPDYESRRGALKDGQVPVFD